MNNFGEVLAAINIHVKLPEEDARMKRIFICIMFFMLLLTSCTDNNSTQNSISNSTQNSISKSSTIREEVKEFAKVDGIEVINSDVNENMEKLINKSGSTVQERIKVPEGFQRVEVEKNSYSQYMRELPVKPNGSKIKLYNGDETNKDVHVAVLDIDVGNRDLQQCADAVIRLRAEYLYSQGMFERIHFNFTNGFNADYSSWMNGNRIVINGNKSHWVKKTGYSNEYSSFRKYLDVVFAYAGTLSLSNEMKFVPIENMQIGDVFLKGATPGHTVVILDMAENKKTGEKIFMIAQSYMPAQDIHILKNPGNKEMSPWYSVEFGEVLSTPEWEFKKDQLMRFQN